MRIALSGLLSRSRRLLAQLFRSTPLDGNDELDNPLSGVRVPRPRNPYGRTSAVALAEPDDSRDDVNAVGRLPFST
jgi:hypothetical protein